MSKYNKPYHNYNNYSNNKPEVEEPVVEEVEVKESVEMEAVTEPTPAAEVSTPETTEEIKPVEPVADVKEPTEPAPIIGVVNCKLLRMRNKPNTEGEVICELPEGTEIQVDKVNSANDFYKVTTTAGAEGFCMKKFITIK